jgi:hypothetical protein
LGWGPEQGIKQTPRDKKSGERQGVRDPPWDKFRDNSKKRASRTETGAKVHKAREVTKPSERQRKREREGRREVEGRKGAGEQVGKGKEGMWSKTEKRRNKFKRLAWSENCL